MREPTLLPTPAPTATHTLSWGDDAVDAASITIGVGDTVRWVVDQQGGHNVVSGAVHGAPDGRFSSPWLANLNDEWTHTFDTAGRFPYYCNPHPWMVATILVEPCSGQPATSCCWGVRRSWGPEQS
jgi:plastocyanin